MLEMNGKKRGREGEREGGRWEEREGERECEGGRVGVREGEREGGSEGRCDRDSEGGRGIECVDVYVSMSSGVFICICLPTP